MKINLRQDFMTSVVLVIAGPIELFPDNRQLTLIKLFDDHCPFVASLGEPRRDHRVLDGFPMATLTLRTRMWMTSPLWDEKRARHSRPALWLTHQV